MPEIHALRLPVAGGGVVTPGNKKAEVGTSACPVCLPARCSQRARAPSHRVSKVKVPATGGNRRRDTRAVQEPTAGRGIHGAADRSIAAAGGNVNHLFRRLAPLLRNPSRRRQGPGHRSLSPRLRVPASEWGPVGPSRMAVAGVPASSRRNQRWPGQAARPWPSFPLSASERERRGQGARWGRAGQGCDAAPAEGGEVHPLPARPRPKGVTPSRTPFAPGSLCPAALTRYSLRPCLTTCGCAAGRTSGAGSPPGSWRPAPPPSCYPAGCAPKVRRVSRASKTGPPSTMSTLRPLLILRPRTRLARQRPALSRRSLPLRRRSWRWSTRHVSAGGSTPWRGTPS